MMNVLIVRTSSMGDIVHTWPAITELKKNYPNLKISWLAEEGFADLPALHPAVGDVIQIAWRRWRRQLCSPATWHEVRMLKARLRARKWDLIVDSQGLLKSAVPAKLAAGPLAGYAWGGCREPLASLFYNQKIQVDRQMSAVERNRYLFSRIFGYVSSGKPVFGIVAPEKPDWVQYDHYCLALHATSRESKEWPEGYWIELANELARSKGFCTVFPWGNQTEHARAVSLAQCCTNAYVAPKMTLLEAASLIANASVVVGVDTGLTHLANALSKPLIAIYTDTAPEMTGVVESDNAINLGGVGVIPSVGDVLETMHQLKGLA